MEARGLVDAEWLQSFDISAEIIADKTRQMKGITVLEIHTDQSGIVGLVRMVHRLGMMILQLQIVPDGANDTEDVNTGSEKG